MRGSAERTLAGLLALVPLTAGVVVLFISFLSVGLQCDDACTGENWQHTAGAWQWHGLFVVGIAAFVMTVAFFVFVLRGRPATAVIWLVGAGITTFARASWNGWDLGVSMSRHPLLLAAIGVTVVSGLLAALLCAQETPRDVT
jgi:hypothetical protein